MADLQFAPPLQRLAPPLPSASVPPPPPPAPVPAAPRLSPAPVPVREASGPIALSFQDLIQPAKADLRGRKKKRKRGKKLFALVVVAGLCGGAYAVRNAEAVQRVFGRGHQAKPLPLVPFVRPNVTSAQYTVKLSAVQNGVPNNVTTVIKADYVNGVSEMTIENQSGGEFTKTDEIRTPEFVFRPDVATPNAWTRQPRPPEISPYDSKEFIPMIEEIVDQTLRDSTGPDKSTTKMVDDQTITTLTYRLDRATVPEIAPAIWAKVPWLFDVPNATTLTVVVGYDESGLVRHLYFGVDPPQPGTGIDATWVTSFTMDVTTLNVPAAIVVPVVAVDVPAGTP